LPAVAVIDIYNCNRFALSFLVGEPSEQLQLGVEVVFHCPVKIEMVLGKICKDGNVPFQAARAILRKRVGRDFHCGRLTTRIGDLRQQLLQIQRLRRGADGRQKPLANLVAHSSD
jgi:hypothetical protein